MKVTSNLKKTEVQISTPIIDPEKPIEGSHNLPCLFDLTASVSNLSDISRLLVKVRNSQNSRNLIFFSDFLFGWKFSVFLPQFKSFNKSW
jgi:hypothetical protein